MAFRLPDLTSRFLPFPVPICLVSHASLSIPVLGFLFVSFHPSLLRSHSRSASARFTHALTGFRFSVFPSPIRFSFASFPVLTTQPSVLLFPSSLSSLTVAVQVLTYPRSLLHFSCFRSHFGTQPCCNSFLLRLLRFTAAIQPFILSFRLSDVPLGFRFRFRLLGRAMYPEN